MSVALIVIVAVAALLLVTLAAAVRIVREYERLVVFRLGHLRGARGPGLVLIIPLVERTRWVNLQVDTADIPPQDLITKDNVTVRVEAAVFFRVVDPVRAVVAIRDYQHGVLRIAQTTLRATLGQHELDDLLANQAAINELLKQIIDAATEPWGVKATRIEIKDLSPPPDITNAMARQMKAERERRAIITEADGEKTAAITRAEGAKQAAVLEAEGRKEAAFRDAEARERSAQAEAAATRMVSEATAHGDVAALNYLIADKYVRALQAFAQSPNQKVFIVPLELASLAGTLGGIATIAAGAMREGEADAATRGAVRGAVPNTPPPSATAAGGSAPSSPATPSPWNT